MLDPDQQLRLRTLFAEAVELPEGERAAFVARSCADDPALRRELEAMLEVHEDDEGEFLATPLIATPRPAATADGGPDSGSASRPTPPLPEIDGYEQIEHIAEGGMGAVFKAQQTRPVRRTVALKVIKKGMDSDAVLARFEAERQAMALMSHPYIATVHDAGTDREGRPFIAMEYVPGAPITEFCETEGLTLEQRLELIVKVCHAVEHAHRRGVLHRDLKPSNVIVSRRVDEAVPKVIDFGIAKAMQGALGEQSIYTEHGSFLGTPEYMSPEQVDGSAFQIDTRSDVYSLGVMLYELLTSQLPFPSERLRQASYSQLRRIVHEDVPPRPSTRVRERSTADADQAAPRPSTTSWHRRLHGDLDWIAMKALEKEPDRRYASARDLAVDLENFLAHRPVSAGPPSGAYRVRKFVRRYRVQVTAAALVLLSLLAGLFGTLYFLFEANVRAAESEAARRDAEGVRLATEAMLQAEENPGLALLLALEASTLTDDHAVNEAIYQALPHHRELRVLVGHEYGANHALFLPDGRRLLSAARDSTPLLWDADTGELLRRYAGHTHLITHIDLDPTGQRLLTTSLDGTARVWNVESGGVLHDLRGHAGPVDFGAFGPDGALVATASRDGTARIWNARNGRPLHEPLEHVGFVLCLAFDSTGRRLVTRAADDLLRVWNVDTGDLENSWSLPKTTQYPRSVDEWLGYGQDLWCQPDGDRIMTYTVPVAGGYHLRIDSLEGELERVVPAGRPPAFLDDGRRLLVPQNSEARRSEGIADVVTYVDLASGETTEQPAPGRWFVHAVSPDERYAVFTDERRDLEVVDLQRDASLGFCRGHRFKNPASAVAFAPDGRRFASASGGASVRIWETLPEFAPRDLAGIAGHNESNLATTAEGTYAVIEQRDEGRKVWAVWNVDTWQRLFVIDDPRIYRLAISRDGSRLLGFVRDPRVPDVPYPPSHLHQRMLVFDGEGRLRREVTLEDPYSGYAIRPDGKEVAFREPPYRGAGSFAFYDLDTLELVHRLETELSTWTVNWSAAHDWARVAACYHGDAQTEVIDVATGEVTGSVKGPGTAFHMTTAFSPDGRYLLIAYASLQVLVWDLESDLTSPSAAPIARYTGLTPAPHWCGFAAGGRLAWVGCNNEVHIFEAMTAEPFAVLRLDSELADMCVSFDGETLVTLTRDGIAQRWPLDPIGTAKQRAQDQLGRSELDKHHIGTPAERLRRERELLRSRPTPRSLERLGDLDLEQGDLDGAIAHYRAACDLGPHAPLRRDLYLRFLELLCRRLDARGGDDEQRRADREHAFEALAHALRCEVSREELLALSGIDALRPDPRLVELLGR